MSEKRCKSGKSKKEKSDKFVCKKCDFTANKKSKLCKPEKQ